MTLAKDNWNSPWGKPPSGGGGGNRGGGSGGGNPPPPDFDELFRKSQERLKKMFPPPTGDGKNDWRAAKFFVAAFGLLWVFSGVYQVGTKELGVVTRFGAFSRTTPPGIHYHLPYPIEAVQTPEVTTVNKAEIGFISGVRGSKSQSKPEESLMLTKDENIVDIRFEVQWKIATPQDYLFNIRSPESTVKAVAESAMREAIGQMDVISVLSGGEGKKQAEDNTRRMMQRMLDHYKAGVSVESINLIQPEPPAEVLDAWRDVQSARVDMETARNEALAYRNDIIPRARGQAEQIVQDAEAYKQQVVAKATGEATRFSAIYEEYKQAPAVTSKRMYIETMEDVLRNMQKIIVDSKAGNGVVPFLPLNDLKPKSPETKP